MKTESPLQRLAPKNRSGRTGNYSAESHLEQGCYEYMSGIAEERFPEDAGGYFFLAKNAGSGGTPRGL